MTGTEGGDVKDNSIPDPADREKKVTASSEVVKDRKGAPASIKLTVKNGTDYDYEVVVDKTMPGAEKKGKVVKAGRDATIARIDKGGSNVYVRRCADQRKAVWATDYIQMGVIPAAKTESSGDKVTKDDLKLIAEQFIESEVELPDSARAGDAVDVGMKGAGFSFTKKEFIVTDEDENEKTIKNVSFAVKVIDEQSFLDTSVTDSIKYGANAAKISTDYDSTKSVKAVITITSGGEEYPHTVNFVRSTNQQLLESLAGELMLKVGKVEVSEKDQNIIFYNETQAIDWENSKDYTIKNRTLKGVTIEVKEISDTTNYKINTTFNDTKKSPVLVKANMTAFQPGTLTITVSFSTDNGASCEKEVQVIATKAATE